MRVRIYLDVDGVINALTKNKENLGDTGWPVESFQTKKIYGYQITWSTYLVDVLNDLAANDDVEIRWLTTWGSLAQTHLAPGVGLHGEDWTFLTDGYHTTGPMHGNPWSPKWWKLDAIRDDIAYVDIEDDLKVFWLDDDINYQPNALRWAAAHPRVSPISPESMRGLTPGDIHAILAVVDGAVGERVSD